MSELYHQLCKDQVNAIGTVFTTAVFIVGEMSGLGVLALPSAVKGSGERYWYLYDSRVYSEADIAGSGVLALSSAVKGSGKRYWYLYDSRVYSEADIACSGVLALPSAVKGSGTVLVSLPQRCL